MAPAAADTGPIRVGARALIIEDDAVLLVEIDDETGLHYNLPGGGVESGESIREALRREVREETGTEVTVGKLLWVIEYEPERNQFWAGTLYKLSLIFACRLQDGARQAMPALPDTNQTAVKWVPLSELGAVELLPHITDLVDQYAAGRAFSSEFLEEPIRPEKARRYRPIGPTPTESP